ncbi:UDP-glucosyltransferase 29 [Linum grandiflorum]
MANDGGGGQQQKKRTTVLILPWLGHGHISPYLELAKRLSTRNFNVYLCSTPANLNPLKPKLLKSSYTITLIELHLPSTPQLPPHYHTTNGLPPDLMPHLKSAFDSEATRASFSSVLVSVSPDLLIYDFLQPWAPQLASSLLHIPAVMFLCPSAAMCSFEAHCSKFAQDDKDARILKWLDAKQTSSTVFVSFGSEFFLTPDQIHEIAHGLELSGANFVWVMRFPLGDQKRPNSVTEALPLGFLDRVGEKGLVVQGWAPQQAILAHDSVGGFVSHCGWSSVMESMWYGVPIVAMPMQLDQPLNARLLEEIGVGVEVKREGRSGKVDRKEVGKVIREVVMVEKKENVVRRKAKEMSEVMKKKGDQEIDDVVRELLQLCRTTSVNYN